MSGSSDEEATYEFDAFASYSTDPDYRLVRQTESFLESFHRLTASTGIELRSLNVCVDGSDFRVSKRGSKAGATDTDPVSGLIADNLARSRRLVLFCSANAVRSPWVDQELRWFLEHRGPASILIALTEGRDPGAHPEECFSATAIAAGLHTKPWYDLRQANPKSKSWDKVKELGDERVRLAAHLNDRSAGEILPLWRREERLRQRRKQWITSAVAMALLVLAAAAVWFGINAERQRRMAVARLLAAQSDARLDASGEGLQQSLVLATESLRSAWTAEGYASWARAAALAPRRPKGLDVGGASVVALDHHPDQSWLALASDDGLVRIVDLLSNSTLRTLRLVDRSLDPPAQWPGALVKFSPDGAWLAAVAGRTLSIWETESWNRTDFEVDATGYFDLAFDRSGKRLAIGGYDQPVRFIRTGSWREERPPSVPDGRKLRAIGLADTHAVTASRAGEISFWDLGEQGASPQEVLRVDFRGDALHDLALGPTDLTLALIMERSGLHLWSNEAVDSALRLSSAVDGTPRPLAAQDFDQHRGSWTAESPPAHLVSFSPSGAYLMTSAATARSPISSFGTSVRLWDASTGREIARIHPGGPATFVPESDALAIGGVQPAVWPLPERGTAASLAYSSEVESVAFSPDGRWIAAGLGGAMVVVRRTGSWTDEFVTPVGGPVRSVGFTPDGRWLIVQSGEGVDATSPSLHVYATGTWQATPSRQHEDEFSVFLSPDGRSLRTHTPSLQMRYEGLKRASRTRIWDISTAEEVAWRSHDDELWSGKISIAQGTLPLGEEGDLDLLERAADWPALRLSVRRPGGMNFGRASPEDRWLAGYGGGGARQGFALLEPATGRRLVNLRTEDARIRDVSFSPDGRWLASAEGSSVDIWLLGPVDALIAESCARLARNFTAEEWAVFVGGKPRATCDTLSVEESPVP